MSILDKIDYRIQRLRDLSKLNLLGFNKKATWTGYENIDIGNDFISRLRFNINELYFTNRDVDIVCMLRHLILDKTFATELFENEGELVKFFEYNPRRIFAYSSINDDSEIVTGNLTLMEITQDSNDYRVLYNDSQKGVYYNNVGEFSVNKVLSQHKINATKRRVGLDSTLIRNFRYAMSRNSYHVERKY